MNDNEFSEIGSALEPADIDQAVDALAEALRDMDLTAIDQANTEVDSVMKENTFIEVGMALESITLDAHERAIHELHAAQTFGSREAVDRAIFRLDALEKVSRFALEALQLPAERERASRAEKLIQVYHDANGAPANNLRAR